MLGIQICSENRFPRKPLNDYETFVRTLKNDNNFSIYDSLKPYFLDFMIKNMFALLNCKAPQFIMLLQSLLLR